MTKFLLICGSPRKGNSYFITNEIAKKFRAKTVILSEKNISHCTGCLYCDTKKECRIKDDTQEMHGLLQKADIIIIVTPNYFDNVPGILKDFIDRTNPLYETGKLNGKKLVTIVVGGGEVANSKRITNHALKYFAGAHGMNIVGSFYFKALQCDELSMSKQKKKLGTIFNFLKEL